MWKFEKLLFLQFWLVSLVVQNTSPLNIEVMFENSLWFLLQVQPVRVVWRPSVQPRLRCGRKQLHPSQQLLVWRGLPHAARYSVSFANSMHFPKTANKPKNLTTAWCDCLPPFTCQNHVEFRLFWQEEEVVILLVSEAEMRVSNICHTHWQVRGITAAFVSWHSAAIRDLHDCKFEVGMKVDRRLSLS